MNRPKEAWVHAALLLLCLGLAWGAWKADPPKAREQVAVYSPGAGGVQRVAWEDDESKAELTLQGDRISITAGRRTPPNPDEAASKEKPDQAKQDDKLPPLAPDFVDSTKPDAGTSDAGASDAGASDAAVADKPDAAVADKLDAGASDAGAKPSAEPDKPGAGAAEKLKEGEPRPGEWVVRAFPGNEAAKKLLEELDPLRALREFGDLSPEELKAMGLDAPRGRLVIESRQGSATFLIGLDAHGTQNAYAKVEGKPQVYLLPSTLISALRGAEFRLMERALWGGKPLDYVQARLEGPRGEPVELVHQGRHDPDAAYWSRKDSQLRESALDGVMDQLLELRANTYPAQKDKPREELLVLKLKATLAQEGGGAETLSLYEERTDNPTKRWFARSDKTGALVPVSPTLAAELAEGPLWGP